MATASLPYTLNCEPIALAEIPVLPFDEFRGTIAEMVVPGTRLVGLFGQPLAGDQVRLFAVLADRELGRLYLLSTDAPERYPAITRACPAAHYFEREIAEQWGLVPEQHPWLKPIRFHRSYRPGHDAWGRGPQDPIDPCVTDFFRMRGQEIHQVAVGPVHAGVIEPGHFRFQCHGEHVYHLEISLGYQHRGVEPALVGGPNKRSIHYFETLAGDTSIGHTLAHCQAVEALAGCRVPLRADIIRAIALELERLANHTGDLGAIANDVGFLPTASYCGRLRGDFLNATAAICGSRFGRGLVRPGGVAFDLNDSINFTLRENLEKALVDVAGATSLLWNTLSVQARLENTGAITQSTCEALGIVGLAARACGIDSDVRHDFPTGIYRFAQIPLSTCATGDVFARASVRDLEIQRSGQFVLNKLRLLSPGPVRADVGNLAANAMVVSMVEGWRGAICHVAITDDDGRFARYKVIDPSFHNWVGLAMALRNQQISDFPLCNKSFNLSYCGHDL